MLSHIMNQLNCCKSTAENGQLEEDVFYGSQSQQLKSVTKSRPHTHSQMVPYLPKRAGMKNSANSAAASKPNGTITVF